MRVGSVLRGVLLAFLSGYGAAGALAADTPRHGGTLTYLIPTESKHPDEAYKFLEFALSREVQIKQTLAGGTSLRRTGLPGVSTG